MSKTEICLYNELTELIYSKIAYSTVLVSRRNDLCVAPLAALAPQTRTRHWSLTYRHCTAIYYENQNYETYGKIRRLWKSIRNSAKPWTALKNTRILTNVQVFLFPFHGGVWEGGKNDLIFREILYTIFFKSTSKFWASSVRNGQILKLNK